MWDVGWAEILMLAALALLIFGPDKLPSAARDAGRLVRRLRELSKSAQDTLGESGVDIQGLKEDLQVAADLHPKRIIASAMEPVNEAKAAVKEPLASPQRNGASASAPVPPPPPPDLAGGSVPPPPPPVDPRFDPDAT